MIGSVEEEPLQGLKEEPLQASGSVEEEPLQVTVGLKEEPL